MKTNRWADIKFDYIKPKPKIEEGIDWLDIVEKTKRECKSKTIAISSYTIQSIKKYHISNKTEINKVI